MDNKKADNIINGNKEKETSLTNEIDNQKNEIKKIDNMQEEFKSINRSVNRTIELLSTSISGSKTNSVLNEIYEKNSMFLKKTSNILDEKKQSTKQILNDLYIQKEEIEKKRNKEE